MNLADPLAFKDRGMVRPDGSITFDAAPGTYCVTDFIPIQENESITINKDLIHSQSHFALFDENKNVIAGSITKNRTLPYIAGAKYAVFFPYMELHRCYGKLWGIGITI